MCHTSHVLNARAHRFGKVLVLAWFLGGLAAPLWAATPRVAVLVGGKVKQLLEASQHIQGFGDVQAEVYSLYDGSRELDRAQKDLRSQRHDAVVALGAKAQEYYEEKGFVLPYAATFVLDSEDPHVVPMNPSPEAWAAFMAEALPRGSQVGTLAVSPVSARDYEALAQALRSQGLSLSVAEVRQETEIPRALDRLLKSSRAFYYPRSKALLKKKVAVLILKESNAAKIPVLGFSSSLVAVGATFALEIDTENLASAVVQKALQRPGDPIPTLHTNASRMKAYGISLPGTRMAGAKVH